MASPTLTEAEIVQNAALSAIMVWRCGIGYQTESDGRPMDIHVAFLVLPTCLHAPTLAKLLSTQRRSGLSLFAAKLADNREDLLALHVRARSYRTLTLQAIGIGIQARLLSVDYVFARVRANSSRLPQHLPDRITPLIRGAERVGAWFGRLTLEEVATTLRIGF